MSDIEDKTYQATPPEILREHFMDITIPHNEEHWWAIREISRLQRELAEWKTRCAELEQNAEHIKSSDEAEDLRHILLEREQELAQAWETLDLGPVAALIKRAESAENKVQYLREILRNESRSCAICDKYCALRGGGE